MSQEELHVEYPLYSCMTIRAFEAGQDHLKRKQRSSSSYIGTHFPVASNNSIKERVLSVIRSFRGQIDQTVISESGSFTFHVKSFFKRDLSISISMQMGIKFSDVGLMTCLNFLV
jgi:hypothetical protein